jgi:hypothetical protein
MRCMSWTHTTRMAEVIQVSASQAEVGTVDEALVRVERLAKP